MSRNTAIIQPTMITWARQRARLNLDDLLKRFPKISDWEAGKVYPTLRQLENFAKAVHIPIGYLFLPHPLEEKLPIADFRTFSDQELSKPSPNLLDALYICQERQNWYHEFMRIHKYDSVPLVGTASLSQKSKLVAKMIEGLLGLSFEDRKKFSNWSEALRIYIQRIEDLGVLIMASSIVGSNTHRHLDVQEFRGFALTDKYAPLIFLNTNDSKAAQMFTLFHEFTHILLGQSGISNAGIGNFSDVKIERFCNEVAAEFLMPMELTRQEYRNVSNVSEEISRLTKIFKVSSLVALRRLLDASLISQELFWKYYNDELEKISRIKSSGSSGGDFYRTLGVRVSKRFALAVVGSALEGQTLFRDAFRMLGFKKSETFYKEARQLGLIA